MPLELERSDWKSFFDGLSHDLEDWETTVHVLSGDTGAQVLSERLPFHRKGGTISIAGVYVGFGDKIPIGAAMNKGLTIKQGQTHTHKYMPMLVDKIENGEIDLPLDDAPAAYEMFKKHDDGCMKVVLKPYIRREILLNCPSSENSPTPFNFGKHGPFSYQEYRR